ncbi:uncharacterized protein LOC111318974 [Stylophora pistillata]|uniref:uncharacterized protein LOC111318974 n=1 Tax=Stylophora pistillata TaxID=50429 RepID=UPI000C0451DF|nr:uncharacterized protein LOC111318974 [Stylophora pistillata]
MLFSDRLDKPKQESLAKLFEVIEYNVLVLSECPHLLHSCLRGILNVPDSPSPWLEYNRSKSADLVAVPITYTAHIFCIAMSSDEGTVAGALGRSLVLFDASTGRRKSRPFVISRDTITHVTDLKFLHGDQFIYFGCPYRLFSVERGRVEECLPLLDNRNSESSLMERVKSRETIQGPSPCKNRLCLANLLALFTMREIKRISDGEITFYIRLRPPCAYECFITEIIRNSMREHSWKSMRQRIIKLYVGFYRYQGWDLRNEMPVLLHKKFTKVSAMDIDAYPESLLYEKYGVERSDYAKSSPPHFESVAVRESIAAVFFSINVVVTVASNGHVTFWNVTEKREKIAFKLSPKISKFGDPISSVKSCVFSPSGQLIAIHHGNNVELYCLEGSGIVEFLCTVFLTDCKDVVSNITFSSDSSSLLFCVKNFRDDLSCFVWDVTGKCTIGKVKSKTLLAIESCCTLSHKRELILCGEYQIEVWKYDEDPSRLLTRLGVEKPYQSVEFRQCSVSLNDKFLICCIANRILLYNLRASQINSSKLVLCGHLGRIDFCQFLKENRYLISYGIDGMVFLWDINESKAVGFAKIAHGDERITSMAVSPEENEAVCFVSSGRVCLITLRGLCIALPFRTPPSSVKYNNEKAETNLQFVGALTSTSQESNHFTEDDSAEAMSISDSDEDMSYYYSQPDVLLDSD